MSYADPARAPKDDTRIDESTGPVASDSLAAESISSGGGFSENKNAVPLGVAGGQSTFANTDTSGATALHSATSGAARQKQDFEGMGSDERGSVGVKYPGPEGQPDFSGAVRGDGGYYGGPSSAATTTTTTTTTSGKGYTTGTAAGRSDFGADTLTPAGEDGDDKISSSKGSSGAGGTGDESGSGGSSGGAAGVRPYVDAAPTYTGAVTGDIYSEGTFKPKGDDLTEGGIPKTKTFTGDVGGPHDPGRLAEQKFDRMNAAAGGDSGLEKTEVETGDDSKGQYGVLQSERA